MSVSKVYRNRSCQTNPILFGNEIRLAAVEAVCGCSMGLLAPVHPSTPDLGGPWGLPWDKEGQGAAALGMLGWGCDDPGSPILPTASFCCWGSGKPLENGKGPEKSHRNG